jgi:ABC-type lipoprotein export system ATPase subunit
MIGLRNIFKYYKGSYGTTYVLRDVSLTIEDMGMLDEPSEGEYYFIDQAVHNMKEKERSSLHSANIGFVFQSYHLIDELTVYENLETPLLYKKVKASERKSIVCDTLDRFNIVGKQKLFPNQLSGGQQQLVGVARAVMMNTKLILADEPTGNLNSTQGEEIMELFTKLNIDGTTIVQVTHSEKNASYSNRIIHLLDGRIEKEDTTESSLYSTNGVNELSVSK